MTTNSILNRYFYPEIIQTKSIINHPFKILIKYLKNFNTPWDCVEDGFNICNLYFATLDTYYSLLNEEKKTLSNHELNKRKLIKEQKNIYLQIALMDPKIYDTDEIFDFEFGGLLDDYNADFKIHCFLMFTDEKEDEWFKKKYKRILNLIKKIDNLIENKSEN